MNLTLSEKCLNDFIKLIHELTGITIATTRNSMVEARLKKRLLQCGLSSYETYLKLVREDRVEQTNFIDIVTTNETYFYRTPRIWEFIEKKFLPDWFSSHSNTVFHAWSAASSSGEEASTLGIICQAFKEKNPSFNYTITGTDISKEMIAICQKGSYSGRSLASIKKNRPDLFGKYFIKKENESYQIQSEIKDRIRFHQHNLFHSLVTKDKFELVLIRNVLIYFNSTDQEKVISLIGPKMTDEGIMIIGESESLTHINTKFKLVEPLVYRHGVINGILKAS